MGKSSLAFPGISLSSSLYETVLPLLSSLPTGRSFRPFIGRPRLTPNSGNGDCHRKRGTEGRGLLRDVPDTGPLVESRRRRVSRSEGLTGLSHTVGVLTAGVCADTRTAPVSVVGLPVARKVVGLLGGVGGTGRVALGPVAQVEDPGVVDVRRPAVPGPDVVGRRGLGPRRGRLPEVLMSGVLRRQTTREVRPLTVSVHVSVSLLLRPLPLLFSSDRLSGFRFENDVRKQHPR